MAKLLNDQSIKMAVEIAKAAVPAPSGSYITDPETVAKFIEIVATRIFELQFGE